MEIRGTSAVITGGGNGIGRAIALALAREGTNVAVADLEADAAASIWRSAERRPEHLGGPQEVDPARGKLTEEHAMPAAEAADMVLQGIREGRFFLLTHPHVIEYARTRWEEVDAAFAEQAPRYEGDDRYDVVKAIARIRAERTG